MILRPHHGTQFTDDFSTAVPPWRQFWNLPRDQFIVTNGVLELLWQGPDEGAFGLLTPAPDLMVRDFHTSVDILDWTTSGTNWSAFGLIARAVGPTTAPTNAYIAGLSLNSQGIQNNALLYIWYGPRQMNGPTFSAQQYPPPYRLQFAGVGSRLSLRVLGLTTGQLIKEMNLTSSNFVAEGG